MRTIGRPDATTDPLESAVQGASDDELIATGLNADDIVLVRRVPAWNWPAGLYLNLAAHFNLDLAC